MRKLLATVLMLVVSLMIVATVAELLQRRAGKANDVPAEFNPHELPLFEKSARPPPGSKSPVRPPPRDRSDPFRG